MTPSPAAAAASGSRGHQAHSHSPPRVANQAPLRATYGHRVLIASLFLPDTITFHEVDDSVIASPNNQSSAPPSPSAESPSLPLHELGKRLAGVNAAFREAESTAAEPDSDGGGGGGEGTPMQGTHHHHHARKKSATAPAAAPSSHSQSHWHKPTPHSTSASSPQNAQPTQVNMSQLMAEATRPPNLAAAAEGSGPGSGPGSGTVSASGTKSRRSSSSAQPRPTLASFTPADPTPTSSVADHGRGQDFSPTDAAGLSTSPGASSARPGLPRNSATTGVGSTSAFNASGDGLPTLARPTSSASTSRRGSTTSNTGATPTAGASGAGGSHSALKPAPTKKPSDPTGTRTPGGAVAGKAGTLMPLSIIGDLQARQSQLASTPMATPGDAERHHPFGGGAVTPFRGAQTPGHAPRTPGLPPGAHTPGAPNKGFGNALSGRAVPGLSMTKAHDTGSAGPGAGVGGSSLAAKRGGAATTGASTPFPAKKGDGLKPTAPGLHRMSSSTASAVASGSFNDHGRGVEVAAPAPRASQPDSDASSHQSKRVSYASGKDSGESDRESPSTDSTSPATERQQGARLGRNHSISSGPPNAPSSSWNRSGSKARLGSRARTSLGRSKIRRSSVDTLSTFAEDVGVDDDSPEYGYGSNSYEYGDELPPYDFVPNPASNGGLVNAIASLSDRRKLRGPGGGKVFIGSPGFNSDEEWLHPRHRTTITSRYKDERSAVPVWIKGDIFRGAYQNFCKGILWPTFHYTLPTDKALEGEHEAFECYRELNLAFARQIAEEWKEGDIVLVNDYHLLLVPQMLRELVPSATIGMFVHIAFPSSELFRCLAMRETLLRGMLGADLVGFQTHNFCRHFRQTVSRILQLEATPKGVQTETFFTTVSPFPIGIDPRNLNAKRSDPEVAEWVAKLTERYEGKKVIVGRDKLDWIRGVRQKLLAFEVFLNEHPEWVGKVVLIQVALATNEENEEAGEANDVVSRINSKYSSLTYQPVVFLHVQDITFSQYLALLTVADGFMANSLREGMNLTTHEYIICQEEKQSPLILSEFTGTYSALRACIGINPWNTKQVAHAIHKALSMTEAEQRARWADLHRTVVTQTALQWITSLLSRLERAHIEQQRRDNAFIPKLEIGQLVSEWRASKTRLILLDLEGSLLPESILLLRDTAQFNVPEEVVSTLRELSEDPRNAIYVLSSLSTAWLDKVAERLPNLGFVAEDGCAVKHPGRPEWISLIAGLNNAWKSSVTEILRYFQDRTPGSFLHDRGATLFFSTGQSEEDDSPGGTPAPGEASMSGSFYRSSSASSSTLLSAGGWGSGAHSSGPNRSQESQWARRQLAEINNLVYDSLGERFSLRIIPRGTTLTVMPKNVSRASAAQHIVQLQAMGVLSQMGTGGGGPSTGKSGAQSEAKGDTTGSGSAAEGEPRSASAKVQERFRPWENWSPNAYAGGTYSPRADTQPPAGSSPKPGRSRSPIRNGSANANGLQPDSASGAGAGAAAPGLPSTLSAAASAHAQSFLHCVGPTGNFDFALYIGQDERLMGYVASLDLPFAPLTVTTGDVDLRGSEAGFSLPNRGSGAGAAGDGGGGGVGRDGEYDDGDSPPGGNGKAQPGAGAGAGAGRVGAGVLEALKELVAFRRRDLRWGVPASVDI